MKILKMIGIGILALFLIAVIFLVYRFFTEAARSQTMSPDLGVIDSRLSACPASPNCVSSYETDGIHSTSAIGGDTKTLNALISHIESLENTQIVERSDNYIHATYRSSLFGFVDDLELYFDGASIHIRSASRVGYSDMGANLKRAKTLGTIASEHKANQG